MSATEEAVEQVAEAIETVGEETADVVRSLTPLRLGYALVGFGLGFVVGGFVTNKRLAAKYEALAAEEIAELRVHYREKMRNAQPQEKPDLKEVVEDLGYATRHAPDVVPPGAETPPTEVAATPVEDSAPKVEVEVEVKNVFEEQDYRGLSTDVWDHDKELAQRDSSKPYIIHKEEFIESALETATVTYYIQDDVLADASDHRIEDLDGKVGLENLEKFGHGSEDANVVYVRNEKLGVDFEVLRSGGSYTAEVLGVDEPEEGLRHSGMRRRRPRFDDD